MSKKQNPRKKKHLARKKHRPKRAREASPEVQFDPTLIETQERLMQLDGAVKDTGLPARKSSELLIEFARPLIGGPTEDLAYIRSLYRIACVTWNLALLPARQREKALDDLDMNLFDDAEQRWLFEDLIERKLFHFPEYKRRMENVSVVKKGKLEYSVQVLATMSPEERDVD